MILRKNIIDYGQPVNRAAPLNRGLLGWWYGSPRGSANGNILPNIFDPPNSGAFVSTPTWASNAGRQGGSVGVTFNGSSSYASTTKTFAFGASAVAMTISYWIKTSSTAQGIATGFVNVGSTAIVRAWINTDEGQANVSGKLTFQLRNDAGAQITPCINPSFNDGNWHHVVFTMEGGVGATYYFDGGTPSITANNTLAGTITGAYAMPIGAENLRGAIGNYANCTLDDVRMYDRVLSSSEAIALYHASRTGYQLELNRISRPIGVKAAAGSSFQAAWARRSNQVIGIAGAA